jgi:hypothetical protein
VLWAADRLCCWVPVVLHQLRHLHQYQQEHWHWRPSMLPALLHRSPRHSLCSHSACKGGSSKLSVITAAHRCCSSQLHISIILHTLCLTWQQSSGPGSLGGDEPNAMPREVGFSFRAGPSTRIKLPLHCDASMVPMLPCPSKRANELESKRRYKYGSSRGWVCR